MSDEPEVQEEGNVLTFSEERKTEKVRYKKKDGTVKTYALVEMMGDGVAAWEKYRMTRVAVRKGKPDPASIDMKDYNATLIAKCLYEQDEATPVPLADIRLFPASMLTALFEKCETMNGLNDEGREDAKKA